MEPNEKMMTGEESLKIITEMINKTKVNFSQSIFHLLLWGWLIFACSLSEFLLTRFTSYSAPWQIWYLTIPGVFVSMIYGSVKGRNSRTFTYGDMISMWTWMGYLVAMILLFILMKNRLGSIPPFILMLTGLPTFISGFVIRFKPLIWGGVSMWILSLVACFGGPDIAPFAVPVAMITGFLIPAYLLRSKNSHDTI
jgi:hypothetical protein